MAIAAIFFLIPMKFNQFGNVDFVDNTNSGSKIMSDMKILFKSNILILVLIISIGIDFSMSAIQVMHPFSLLNEFHISAKSLGYISSFIGCIAIIGSVFAPRFKRVSINKLYIGYFLMLIVLTSSMFMFKDIRWMSILLIVSIRSAQTLIGAIINPLIYAKVQRSLPEKHLGGVTTVFYTIQELIQPISAVIGSWLLNIMDFRESMLIIVFILGIFLMISQFYNYKEQNNENKK